MRAALPRPRLAVSTFFCFPIQIRFVRAENPGWNGNQRSWGQKSVGGPMRRERAPVKRRTGPISAPSGQAAGNCSYKRSISSRTQISVVSLSLRPSLVWRFGMPVSTADYGAVAQACGPIRRRRCYRASCPLASQNGFCGRMADG